MSSSASLSCDGPRGVTRRVPSIKTAEPDGFEVRCPFPTMAVDHIDPFLLLHHLGPLPIRPGPGQDGPHHPHLGVETLTYVLRGELTHRNANGAGGTIEEGSAQWLTAGDGVVHAENPSARMRAEGGTLEAVQVWINLPAGRKKLHAAEQALVVDDLPLVATTGGTVKLIAGDAFGVHGPAVTQTPLLVAHVSVWENQWIDVPAPTGHNAVTYCLRGRDEGMLTIFDGDGDVVRVHAGRLPAEVLVLVGRPLREPIARYGPFVLSTRDELMDAIEDYQYGRMPGQPGPS